MSANRGSGPGRRGAGEAHAQLLGPLAGLGVEVPDHLDVVGDEPDRRDDHGRDARGVQRRRGGRRRPAPATAPAAGPERDCHTTSYSASAELRRPPAGRPRRPAASSGARPRPGVPAAASAAAGTECAVNTSRARSRTAAGSVARAARTASAFAATNSGWSKKCRSFTSSGAPVADGLAGPRDVLVVLPAGRVAAVGAGGEHERPAHAVAGHLGDGVLDQRVPVAVAEVHRQVGALAGRPRSARGCGR